MSNTFVVPFREPWRAGSSAEGFDPALLNEDGKALYQEVQVRAEAVDNLRIAENEARKNALDAEDALVKASHESAQTGVPGDEVALKAALNRAMAEADSSVRGHDR